jgi:hypothetical protein
VSDTSVVRKALFKSTPSSPAAFGRRIIGRRWGSHTSAHTLSHLPDPIQVGRSSHPRSSCANKPLQRSRRQSPLYLKRPRHRLVLSHRGRSLLAARSRSATGTIIMVVAPLAQVVSPNVLYPIERLVFSYRRLASLSIMFHF